MAKRPLGVLLDLGPAVSSAAHGLELGWLLLTSAYCMTLFGKEEELTVPKRTRENKLKRRKEEGKEHQ